MRSPQEQAEFLDSRRHGIGGSDLGSLLSNQIPVEYGCERRLWYRLSEYPQDGPENATEPILLGNILEQTVRDAYQDQTGNRVEVVGLKKHDTIECLQYHDDGIIHPGPDSDRKTPGVLEVKSIGREMMAKVNASGLCTDYVCQLAGGQGAHRLEWGEFALGMREDLLPLVAIELSAKLAGHPIPELPRRPKIVHFQMDRQTEIIRLIEDYAPKFWSTLKNEAKIPPRMEPEDPRCGRCAYKIRCQGTAVMEGIQPEDAIPQRRDLDALVQEYRERSALLEEATELVKETQNKFRTSLDKATAVKVEVEGKWKNIIYRLRRGGERVDGKRMAAAYDALRRAAIDAGVVGAELTPASDRFMSKGMPSRPLLLSGLLPKKEKKPGEVPEMDDVDNDSWVDDPEMGAR